MLQALIRRSIPWTSKVVNIVNTRSLCCTKLRMHSSEDGKVNRLMISRAATLSKRRFSEVSDQLLKGILKRCNSEKAAVRYVDRISKRLTTQAKVR